MDDIVRILKRGESWYEHKLPNKMAKLDSPYGQHLLQRSQQPIINVLKYFVKQRHRCLCGPSSLAIVSNALGLASKISQENRFLDEEDIMENERVKAIDRKWDMRSNGATLQTLSDVAKAIGLKTTIYYVTNDYKTTRMGFKDGMEEEICTKNEKLKEIVRNTFKGRACIIMNYQMGVLGYKGLEGHFSPVGAYSETEDMLLILDTWPETPPAWVKSELVYNAMLKTDNTSKKPRGFIVLRDA